MNTTESLVNAMETARGLRETITSPTDTNPQWSETMDHIDETVKYLAACSPETRDALIAVAMSPLVNTAEKGDDLSAPARVVATIADHPMDVASRLLALNHKPKRGRPRGSKTKGSTKEETK